MGGTDANLRERLYPLWHHIQLGTHLNTHSEGQVESEHTHTHTHTHILHTHRQTETHAHSTNWQTVTGNTSPMMLLCPCSPHLTEVVFKMAELQTLFQLGLVSLPEIIKRRLCLIQLAQQSTHGWKKNGRQMKGWRERDGWREINMEREWRLEPESITMVFQLGSQSITKWNQKYLFIETKPGPVFNQIPYITYSSKSRALYSITNIMFWVMKHCTFLSFVLPILLCSCECCHYASYPRTPKIHQNGTGADFTAARQNTA